jgi:hypothetical protein
VLLVDQGQVRGELSGAALTETALAHAALTAAPLGRAPREEPAS